MKKKARTVASRTGKRRKQATAGSEPTRRATSASRRSAAKDDPKAKIRQLKRRLAEALAHVEQLQAVADTDFLLGIPNRRGFERELVRAISYIRRYHAVAALIVLDVDRLKPINDNFGHAAGDARTDADGRFAYAWPRLSRGTHRIEATGVAFTLVTPDDAENVQNIEKLTGLRIDRWEGAEDAPATTAPRGRGGRAKPAAKEKPVATATRQPE